MDDPTSWNRQLELRLRLAVNKAIAQMADEGTDFPWLSDAVRNRMAQAAVNVLEAVAYHESWLVGKGGLDEKWIP